MPAKDYYDPEAGPWVAYRDEPGIRWDQKTKTYVPAASARPDGSRRIYLYSQRSGVTASSPDQCVRFDTKAEALAAGVTRWGSRRYKGFRRGAERIQ